MDRYGRATKLIRLLLVLCLVAAQVSLGQGGYNDDRVMIQGFMWESHQEGKHQGQGGYQYEVHWKHKWYNHVKSKVAELADARFNLIWLPPPSHAGDGAGYHPQEYHWLFNDYGTKGQHKDLIEALLKAGIEPVADVVINHRNGSGSWATFKHPDWPANYICSTDEFWFQDPGTLNPADQAILAQGDKGGPDYTGSNYPNWHAARDLDHTNVNLRADVKLYLDKLRTFGYRGWRYDMVKGYDPKYIAEYDYASSPTFAVGEYWDGNPNTLTTWVDGTKQQGQGDPALKACCAFDFATYELLKHFINNGMYNHLPAITWKDGIHDGLVAINKDKSVTFLENHDTGFPQKQFDSFGNNDKLMQGYAYILTHPGIPCVYWKHFFEWNRKQEIRALIKARKYAGVHSGSYIKTQVHGNDYVASVGDKPFETSTLIVKIGHGFGFNPDGNIWGLETYGQGYAVWVRKTKKAETQAGVDAPMPSLPPPPGP